MQTTPDLARARTPVPWQNHLRITRSKPSQKQARAVRAAGYNGKPFSGSGTASEELLESMIRDLAESVFPGSTAQTQQDMRLAVDAHETLVGYVYYADIPGVQQDNLKVNSRLVLALFLRASLPLLASAILIGSIATLRDIMEPRARMTFRPAYRRVPPGLDEHSKFLLKFKVVVLCNNLQATAHWHGPTA